MSLVQIPLDNAVIFDTETTGIDKSAQIVEIAIIDAKTGNVLYHSLVNPMCKIPYGAYKVHGISNEEVANAPTFDVVWNQIKGIIEGKTTIAYNHDYDMRLVEQSLAKFGYPIANLKNFFNPVCAMKWYTQFYRESNRWQSLSVACEQQGVDVSDLGAHRAADDCEMTRRLIMTVNDKL